MDYTQNLEQNAIIESQHNKESNLSYYHKKKSSNQTIIEDIFPLGKDVLAVRLSARPLIYIFVRETFV